MRGIGNHTPPVGVSVQPEPSDNTSAFVQEQVVFWRVVGALIHPEIAREIAAGWASGDTAFTAFATTGTLYRRELMAEIEHELSNGVAYEVLDEAGMAQLMALDAYVVACPGQSDHDVW